MSTDLTLYALRQRYAEIESLAEMIGVYFIREIEKLGFDRGEVTLKSHSEANYSLEKDPASGEFTLVGDWVDRRGYREGTLLFHADGSFYAEQNVVRPHPTKKQWFVEAVNAWGRGCDIKAEARLMLMPE